MEHPTNVNHIIKDILHASIKIHRAVGPGLLESVYEELLTYELLKADYNVQRQKPIPVVYETIKLGDGFRADLFIESQVIIEIKSLEQLAPVHFKQIQTYLKLAGVKDGVLINFNVNLLKDGFYRRFNNPK